MAKAGLPLVTAYEQMVSNMEVPVGLQSNQRKSLCQALLRLFTVVEGSHEHTHILTASCIDSFLRLLLRLSSSSFDDVKTLAEGDILKVLFKFPHPADFAGPFSVFVGHILRQVSFYLIRLINRATGSTKTVHIHNLLSVRHAVLSSYANALDMWCVFRIVE